MSIHAITYKQFFLRLTVITASVVLLFVTVVWAVYE